LKRSRDAVAVDDGGEVRGEMDAQGLIEQEKAMRERIQAYVSAQSTGLSKGSAAKAQVCEYLRRYAGPNSAFLTQAERAEGHDKSQVTTLTAILDSYTEYLSAVLASELSPERKAQLDVVSDILEQANLTGEPPHLP